MIKRTITYLDYNEPPQEVTEDFYFNLTLLELIKSELKVGGFEALAKRLTETQDAVEAFGLFEDLVLSAYGEKSPDGRGFKKNAELRDKFASSPAISDLIVGFLNKPDEGAAFVESLLPAHLIAEAKAAQAAQEEKDRQDAEKVVTEGEVVLETAPPVLERPAKTVADYTRQELVGMPQEEFDALVGTDIRAMPHEVLAIAMQRKAENPT